MKKGKPNQTESRWYQLNEYIIKTYKNAEIKSGDMYIIAIKSRKKDIEEIKEVICDYWKDAESENQ